jgi:hypothetical protein
MAVGDYLGMKIAPDAGEIDKGVTSMKIAATAGSIDKTVTAVFIYTGSEWKAAPFGILGDVNGDGVVDTSDYTLIRLHVLGLSLLTGNAILLADVNQDGAVDETDQDLVRDYILA